MHLIFNLGAQEAEDIINQIKKEELSKISSIQNSQNVEMIRLDEAETVADKKEADKKEADKKEIDENEKDFNRIFGFNYLNSLTAVNTDYADLPAPNDYVISLNDKIRVILFGSKQSSFDLLVALDGSILFPEIGRISVKGLTYAELKEKLTNLINESYVGVSIDVSLSELSGKKISIIGAVKSPGSYLVNPFTSFSSALAYSGGPEDYASLRNIKILRSSGEEIEYDLYDLLIHGDRTTDLVVNAGDTILIESTNNHIEIIGEIHRPMKYEYKEGETYNDLVEYALGFKSSANRDNIFASTLSENTDSFLTKRISMSKYEVIESSILLEVFSKSISEQYQIKVEGPLTNAGYFSPNTFKSLSDLMDVLKFSDDLYKYFAIVENKNPRDGFYSSHVFSPSDKETHDIDLRSNSNVKFFSVNSIQNFSKIDEFTAVNSIQNFSKIDEFTENFGLNESTSNHLKNNLLTVTTKDNQYYLPLIGKVNLNSITNILALNISDYDFQNSIFINPSEDIINKNISEKSILVGGIGANLILRDIVLDSITVKVSGEASLPGTYTISKDTTLNELYQLFGGVSQLADSRYAIFKRDSVKKSQIRNLKKARAELEEYLLVNSLANNDTQVLKSLIEEDFDENLLGRVAGNFTASSPFFNTFTFEENDSIHIPRKNETVTIIGEVLNPVTLLYEENKRLQDYLSMAGGLKESAAVKQIFVVKADGSVESARGGNIFSGSNSMIIKEGDTIVVPRNIILSNGIGELLIPVTTILSNLALVSASLDSISN